MDWTSGKTRGRFQYSIVTTNGVYGSITSYIAEGEFTDDPLDTFGSRAVVKVPELQSLMHYVCNNGFEHHCAMNGSHVADILEEAFANYMQWDVYRHG